MTALHNSTDLDRSGPHGSTSGSEPTESVEFRRGALSTLRAELRLSRRQAARGWAASLLVIVLVALPIALLTGAAVFASSRVPALDQKITSELGASASWLRVVNGPDPTMSQSTEDPWWWDVSRDEDGRPTEPERPLLDDPTTLLPAGTDVIEISSATVDIVTPGGRGAVAVTVGDAWDPVLTGRYEFLSGRAPSAPDEAMASPGALKRLGAELGDTVVLADSGATFAITGVLKTATTPSSHQEIFVPASARTGERSSYDRVWFTPSWQPTAEDLPTLNHEGVIVYAHDLVRENQARIDAGSAWAIGAGVAIAASFLAYLVVLLAGSAFAVSTRRQQHALSVAASVGAGSRSMFRIVLLQGTVLGTIGGAVGIALGLAIAAIALPVVDDGNAASYWGFNVPWALVTGIAVFAIAVGTASAIAPARAATRGDVLSSLRGARKPVSVRASRPLWGTLLIAAGLGATLAAGLGLTALDSVAVIDYGHPARTLAVVGIIAGPILFQIGIVLAGHWLLSLFARLGARMSLAARIAARDAAAHPSRVVPAFGAIAACVFIASFALTAVAMGMASTRDNWSYSSPLGTLKVDVYTSYDKSDAMEDQALDVIRLAAPDRVAVIAGQASMREADSDGVPLDGRAATSFVPELRHYTSCDDVEFGVCTSSEGVWMDGGQVWIADAADLDVLFGTHVDAAARAVFAGGGAIVTDPRLFDDGTVTLNELDTVTLNRWFENGRPSRDAPIVSTLTLDAASIVLPHGLPWTVVVSPSTARAHDIPFGVTGLVGAFDAPPAQQQLDRVAEAVAQEWDADGGLSYRFESGPPDPAPWLWLILGAAGVLVLGAASVVLGLARIERRPDDATLTAVGAPRRLRRGIAFWQGVVIVGVGSVTGTVAGIIPMWGLALPSLGSFTLADTPWPWLVVLAVGLPLVVALANALVPLRHPDLTRRTAIA